MDSQNPSLFSNFPSNDHTQFNLQKALHTIALTLGENTYHNHPEEIGGMVDVIELFAKKIDNPAFLTLHTELCKAYEEEHTQHRPELIAQLQQKLRELGDTQPLIDRNICTATLIHLLQNIYESMAAPEQSRLALFGEVATIATIIAASPHINEELKLTACRLSDDMGRWARSECSTEQLHTDFDQILHELNLLLT